MDPYWQCLALYHRSSFLYLECFYSDRNCRPKGCWTTCSSASDGYSRSIKETECSTVHRESVM